MMETRLTSCVSPIGKAGYDKVITTPLSAIVTQHSECGTTHQLSPASLYQTDWTEAEGRGHPNSDETPPNSANFVHMRSYCPIRNIRQSCQSSGSHAKMQCLECTKYANGIWQVRRHLTKKRRFLVAIIHKPRHKTAVPSNDNL